MLSRSVVSVSLRPPCTVAHQAPLSMGIFQARILPYPAPGDLPSPEIKPRSPTLQVDSLPPEPPGKPKNTGVGESESEVAQSCPTLCDPVDCSLPGSSVHGILQARMLEGVAFPFSRGSSRPRDQTQVSCIAGRFFTS